MGSWSRHYILLTRPHISQVVRYFLWTVWHSLEQLSEFFTLQVWSESVTPWRDGSRIRVLNLFEYLLSCYMATSKACSMCIHLLLLTCGQKFFPEVALCSILGRKDCIMVTVDILRLIRDAFNQWSVQDFQAFRIRSLIFLLNIRRLAWRMCGPGWKSPNDPRAHRVHSCEDLHQKGWPCLDFALKPCSHAVSGC